MKTERPRLQRGDNPPLHLNMEPGLGADIGDCFDHAADIVGKIGCVVRFEFNGVRCGVRPCDVLDRIVKDSRAIFVRNFQNELSEKTSGCKICYANP